MGLKSAARALTRTMLTSTKPTKSPTRRSQCLGRSTASSWPNSLRTHSYRSLSTLRTTLQGLEESTSS